MFREEKEFPIARTEYKKFFLDASKGALTTDNPEKQAIANYDSLASGPGKHRAEFDIEFTEETEITGYMSAKLFMETSASDNMHVFLTLWKLDKDHQPVGMTYYAQVDFFYNEANCSTRTDRRPVDGLRLPTVNLMRNHRPHSNRFCFIEGSKKSNPGKLSS